MVTLKEVSINNNIVAPKINAGNNVAKCSELGIKNIASADTIQPPSINGILLPSLVHVLSLDIPTIGCTIKPATGAANQNKLRLCGSAPIAERILLVFAFCKE